MDFPRRIVQKARDFGDIILIEKQAVVASGHPFRNGSGNGAFFALVALPGINNLRAVNREISSTPAASTINQFITYNMQL